MKKYWLALVMLCTVALVCFALPEVAKAATYGGYCGGEGDGRNLTWSLDTGTGGAGDQRKWEDGEL